LLFESGSNLVDIEEWVFSDCVNLELINVPASVVNVHGSAFADAEITKISIESGNSRFAVIDDFLVDITEAKLIRYFGSSPVIIVSRAIEIIGRHCFGHCKSLSSLTFEPGSKLTQIERAALLGCSSLKSIVIPASVTTIMGTSVSGSGIRHISVEEGNAHFCVIGHFLLSFARTSLIAFFGITATVTVDRKIQVLCDCCFAGRDTLSRVEFESDSELRRIEWGAFGGCSSLHTICIPSSIQSLEREWFRNSVLHGGVVFDRVQFESVESLSRMIIANCADLTGDFTIEVLNWNGETEIPGYFAEAVPSGGFVRLKKSSNL
jgi:hypothetical protein